LLTVDFCSGNHDADNDDPDVNIRTAMTLLQQKLTVAADPVSVRADQIATPSLRRLDPPTIDRLTPSSKPGIARTIVSPRGPVSPTSSGGRTPQRALVYARALFDYKPSRNDILALKRGYVVAIYQRVTAEWWKGAFRDRVGLLPSNYLQTLAPIGTVTALLDFSGRHKRHLTFAKGDTIFVVKEGELGWLEGFLPFSGAFGRFPGSYVSRTVALPADGSLSPVVNDAHDADTANGQPAALGSGGGSSSRRRARYEAAAAANGVSDRRARHASMPAARSSTPTERRNAAALCDKCRATGVAGRVVYGNQSLMLCAACLDLLQRMATDTDDTELDATELDAKVEPSTLPPLPPLPHNESSTEIDSVRRDAPGSDGSTSDNSEDDAFRTRQLARRQQAAPTQPSPHVATGGLTLRMRELHELEAQIDAKARAVAQMERDANEKLALAQAKAATANALSSKAPVTTAAPVAPVAAVVVSTVSVAPPLPSESTNVRVPPPLPLERVTVATNEDREAKLAADLLRELERFSAPEVIVADAGPVQLSLADFLLPGDAIDDEQALRADELLDQHEREAALGDEEHDDHEAPAAKSRRHEQTAAASNDGDDDDASSDDDEGARDDSDVDRVPKVPSVAPVMSPRGAPPGEPAYSDEQMALLRITQDVDFLFLSADADEFVRYAAVPPNAGLSADAIEMMTLATLPKLIERLTESGEPDARLALHMLNTYSVYAFSTPSLPRAQCTPQMLFRLLKMRFFLGSLTADVSADLSRAGQQAVAVLCRLWTLHSPTDFLDDGALLAEIDHFVHEDIPSTGTPVPRALTDAIEILRQAIASPLLTFPQLDALGAQSAPRITTKTMSVELVAQQLTLIEWHMLRAIRPSELLRQAWSRPGAQTRAPNVARYMRWYNNVRAWAASEVLRGSTPVTRAVALRKLIRVTTALFELRNFNGVMELLSALNAAPVFRLRRTWDLLKPRDVQHFNALNRALDPADNYARYRPLLAAARAERQPCVPFLGAILTDLVELDERWPDTLPGTDLVVLGKMHAVGEVVVALRDAMKPTYAQLSVDERSRARLLAVQGSSDAELVRLSHQLEPPLRTNTLTRQARAKPSRGSLTKSTSSPRTPTAAASSRPTRPGATSSPAGASAAQSATLTEALVAAWEADNAAAESSPDVRGSASGAAAPERAARRVASLGMELDNRAFARLALVTEPLHRDDTYKVVSLAARLRLRRASRCGASAIRKCS
jgi:hypothetical protein